MVDVRKSKERKEMIILNKYNHKKLGEICCIGEDEEHPVCWMKKVKLRAFSDVEEEWEANLNFFCYDINFERRGSKLLDIYAANVEEDVIKSYYQMLEGIEDLEKEFVRFYNSCEFEDEFYPYFKEETFTEELPIVNKIEDIYPYIEDKRLCVYHNGFAIALKLKFSWMSIMIEKTDIFEEDGGYAFTQTIETATPVSMNYFGELKK